MGKGKANTQPKPGSIKKARELVGKEIWKQFTVPGLGTKLFRGVVTEVAPNYVAHGQKIDDPLYHVKYDYDGDSEDLDWDEMAPWLRQQPPSEGKQQAKPARGSKSPRSQSQEPGPRTKPSRTQPKRGSMAAPQRQGRTEGLETQVAIELPPPKRAKTPQHVLSGALGAKGSRQEEPLEGSQASLQPQLDVEAHSGQQNAGGLQRPRRKLAESEQLLKRLQAQIKQQDDLFQQKRAQANDSRDDVNKLQAEQAGVERAMQEVEAEILAFKGQLYDCQQGASARFKEWGGDKMVQLQQLLQQNKHRFQQLPVGPLGVYLKVQEFRWGKAVEAWLWHLVPQFVTFHPDDTLQLMALADECGLNVTASVLPHGLPRHKVAVKYDQARSVSILDVLRISHPDPAVSNAIFNLLVDQGKVGSTLLVSSQEQGRQVIQSKMGCSAVDENGWTYSRDTNGAAVAKPPPAGSKDRPSRIGLCPTPAIIERLQEAVVTRKRQLEELGTELQKKAQQLQQLRATAAARDKDCMSIMQQKKQLVKQLQAAQRPSDDAAPDEDEAMVQTCTQYITNCMADITTTQARQGLADLQQLQSKLEKAEASANKERSTKRKRAAGDLPQNISELQEAVASRRQQLQARCIELLGKGQLMQQQWVDMTTKVTALLKETQGI